MTMNYHLTMKFVVLIVAQEMFGAKMVVVIIMKDQAIIVKNVNVSSPCQLLIMTQNGNLLKNELQLPYTTTFMEPAMEMNGPQKGSPNWGWQQIGYSVSRTKRRRTILDTAGAVVLDNPSYSEELQWLKNAGVVND